MRWNFDGQFGITKRGLPDVIKQDEAFRILAGCMAFVDDGSIQLADYRPVWALLEAMRKRGSWQRHPFYPGLSQHAQYFEGSAQGNSARRQLRAYNELPSRFCKPVHVLVQVEPEVWAYRTYLAPVLLPNAAEAHPSQVALQAHTLESLNDLYGAYFQAEDFNDWYDQPSTYDISYKQWTNVPKDYVPSRALSSSKKITVPLAVVHFAVIKSAVTLRVAKDEQSDIAFITSDLDVRKRVARERDMINQQLRDDQSELNKQVMAMLPEGDRIYQDDEDQTEPEEEDEATCPGCADNQPNQAAHMVPGGCLCDDDEPPTADQSDDDEPPNLKAIEHEEKAREAWRVARQEAKARHLQNTQRHRLEEARMRGPCPQAEIVQLREEIVRLQELVDKRERELDKRDAEIVGLRKQLKGYDADVRHQCNQTLSDIISEIEFDENLPSTAPPTAPSSPRPAPQAPNSLHGGGIVSAVSPDFAYSAALRFKEAMATLSEPDSKRRRLEESPVLMRIPSPEY